MNQTDGEDGSSESESDWEEVLPAVEGNEEVEYIKARMNDSVPENGKGLGRDIATDGKNHNEVESLKIVIPNPNGLLGNRKKGVDIVGNYIIREINKSKRELYLDIHRVGLLCLLARGLRYNTILRDESILSTGLSILPAERAYPPKNMDLNYMEKFLAWYKRTIKVSSDQAVSADSEDLAPVALESKLMEQMGNRRVSGHAYLVFIFVAILRALGVQVRLVWNFIPPPIKPSSSDLIKLLREENGTTNSAQQPKPSTSEGSMSSKARKDKPKATKSKNNQLSSSMKRTKSKRMKKEASETSDSEYSTSDCSSSSDSGTKRRRKLPRKGASKKTTSPKTLKKSEAKVRNSGRKFISSDDEPTPTLEKTKTKFGNDFWAEVFLEEEEQWVSVDIPECKVLSDVTVKAKATHPISYVIAFTNSGHVKDVTNRYSERWWSELAKFRDEKWWMATIRCFRGRKTVHDRREDEFLRQSLQSLPMPTTVAAFKNHPLYALRRHLLKFEAVYPPDIVPCGNMKGEPVYPRTSIHTLCSRETWLRKARVVRIGEKAYKIVKARPKMSRSRGMSVNQEPLELYGEWQTEDFQPPIAANGKVPRNEFGNVDLYLPKMLPIGTVHLQLPGLSKVARKLDVDCAPAVVGFEFHAGGCHPKFDGFVVCEEFREVLLDAWNQEQDEIKKRDEDRRRKRIYDRWGRLCKGLLIREKLEKKYAYSFSTSKASSSSAC